MKNTCSYRDLDKSHKTNGKNWSTSYFLAQTELGRRKWCCRRNKTADAAVLVSNNMSVSGRRWGEVGRGSPILTGFWEAGISPSEVTTQACTI